MYPFASFYLSLQKCLLAIQLKHRYWSLINIFLIDWDHHINSAYKRSDVEIHHYFIRPSPDIIAVFHWENDLGFNSSFVSLRAEPKRTEAGLQDLSRDDLLLGQTSCTNEFHHKIALFQFHLSATSRLPYCRLASLHSYKQWGGLLFCSKGRLC